MTISESRMKELNKIFDKIEKEENYLHSFLVSGYAFHWTVLLVNKVKGELEIISVDPVSYNKISFSPSVLSRVLHEKKSFDQFYLDSLLEKVCDMFQLFSLNMLFDNEDVNPKSSGANWFQKLRSFVTSFKKSNIKTISDNKKFLLLQLVSFIVHKHNDLKDFQLLKNLENFKEFFSYCYDKIVFLLKSEKVFRFLLTSSESEITIHDLAPFLVKKDDLNGRWNLLNRYDYESLLEGLFFLFIETKDELTGQLDISDMPLYNFSIPKSIPEYSFHFVRLLVLRDCGLSKISTDFHLFFPNLVKIVLDFNGFTVFPQVLTNLENLEALSIAGNKITKLPDQLENLTRLCMLSISSNRLSVFPPQILKLKSLNRLYIGSNGISEFPEDFCNPSSLMSLELNANKISSVPPSVKLLTNLQVLNLTGNPVNSGLEYIKEMQNIKFFRF